MPRPGSLLSLLALLSAVGIQAAPAQAAPAAPAPPVHLTVDTRQSGRPFPHYWEQLFGSGRAALGLREDYRQDLRLLKAATGFGQVRAHGIFHDELGLYDEDASGNAVYNFSYIDQLYDGLLAEGVRPFIELSFMPQKLAADPANLFGFWDHPNISPPKDYAKWDALLSAFARHLIERYGIEEVARWNFEVWNEPNAGFWGGKPYQPTYFELYDHSARALKSVSARLRVGGPSTAQAAWVGEFIRHCNEAHVPVDFVSSHAYANDDAQDIFQNDIPVPRARMVCAAVRKVHEEIVASAQPHLPLIWSEYNASYANEPNVTDSVYMGPWLAGTVSQCDGLTEAMGYWTFSDVFEENGVVRTPFYGGYGLIAERLIPKPAYNAFALLHRLGETRLPSDSDAALITKRRDGTVVLALWNYAPPDGSGEHYTPPGAAGAARHFVLELHGLRAAARARLWRLDRNQGNVLKAYDAMGRPPYPTVAQIAMLRTAARLAPPQPLSVKAGTLTLDVPAQGLTLIELR
jgi:xylan 1,4-beta-xylosidase